MNYLFLNSGDLSEILYKYNVGSWIKYNLNISNHSNLIAFENLGYAFKRQNGFTNKSLNYLCLISFPIICVVSLDSYNIP